MPTKANMENIQYYAKLSLHQLPLKNGLQTEEVEVQRRKYGSNCLLGKKKETTGLCLRHAFINPFSVVLMVLAVISCLVDVVLLPKAERNYTTVLIISSMLMISGCIRFSQELKSKRIADKLVQFVDTTAEVKRDGQWQRMDVSELVVGDVVRLSAGERVPADLRLLKVRDCFLSESAITGESALQEKSSGGLKHTPEQIRDYKNMAFCGTTVVNGTLEGLVVAVGNHTVYGEIPFKTPKKQQGYDQGANSIAQILIQFMVLLVPLVFLASGLTKGNWLSAFLFALSVAVGLTPELLPMVITACLAKGSFTMRQKRTLVKNVNAMQGFGNMNILCVDKTGTLTENALLLEYNMDILGNEDEAVLDCAFLNSFYHAGVSNPLDSAILKIQERPGQAEHYDALCRQYTKLDEFPFDYQRKLSSVLLQGKKENLLLAKGNVDDVLAHCGFSFYKGKKIPLDEHASQSVHAIVDEMLEDGMKVLAIACKKTEQNECTAESENNLLLLGYVAFFDAPKKSAAGALQKLNALHVETKILTGDRLDVAMSICRRLGMDVSKRMTGKELDSLSDNDAQVRIEDTLLFAELSPAQKAKIIEVLQSNGHKVGFLADGMNDLPAVRQADVGISVDTAVPSVQESADVLLLEKDLNVLESGITEGRRAFANMSKYVKITASSNLGNIFAIIFAAVFLPFFPMTSIQILLLNLLYDVLCLVLPWDNVDTQMIAKPMEWSGKNLRRFMLSFGPISSVFDVVTFLFLYLFLCPHVCGGTFWTLSLEAQAQFIALFQTGWFLESMWTQVLILHLLRTEKLAFLGSKPSMPFLLVTWLGIGAFTLLAFTPIGNWMGMTALPPYYFLFLFCNVFCYLSAVTVMKKIYIKRRHSFI